MTARLIWIGAALVAVSSPPESRWWDAQVEASLDRAPARKADWVRLLETCPPEHRPGLAYLIKVPAAPRPRDHAPGGAGRQRGPGLPGARRGPLGRGPARGRFPRRRPAARQRHRAPRARCGPSFTTAICPWSRDCKTPGQAALAINKKLFRDYKVGYNTRRLRTDQSSKESIAQGMATCTGLSIMLVEACRAVGVPARLAGIASWPGRGGNHTWVEVWDDGWHFVGAAEPDEKGLDHAWFVGDAVQGDQGELPQRDLRGHLSDHRRLLPARLGPIRRKCPART